MSDNRLSKNIHKQDSSQKQILFHSKPVLISDSKGRYLQNASSKSSDLEDNILWAYKSGATTLDRYLWLKQNIDGLIRKHGKLSVYLWTGTCDLTIRQPCFGLGKAKTVKSKYIQLREKDAVSLLQRHFLMVKKLLNKKGVKLTILQLPYYSITRWNASRGHPNPSVFKADDKRLTQYVETVNSFITRLNTDMKTFSPSLNEDLRRSRKAKNKKQRYSVRYNMYTDGIHPKHKLSKSWLKSISRKIRRDCCV